MAIRGRSQASQAVVLRRPATTVAPSGQPKIWTGSIWVQKPAKVWTGSVWTQKPVKVWTGSTWKTVA